MALSLSTTRIFCVASGKEILLTKEFHSSHMKRTKFYIFIGSASLFLSLTPPSFFPYISIFHPLTFDLDTINNDGGLVKNPGSGFIIAFSFIISRTNHHFVSNFMAFNDEQYLNYTFYCRGQYLSNKISWVLIVVQRRKVRFSGDIHEYVAKAKKVE